MFTKILLKHFDTWAQPYCGHVTLAGSRWRKTCLLRLKGGDCFASVLHLNTFYLFYCVCWWLWNTQVSFYKTDFDCHLFYAFCYDHILTLLELFQKFSLRILCYSRDVYASLVIDNWVPLVGSDNAAWVSVLFMSSVSVGQQSLNRW